jgi:hypothetical protein
MRKPLLLLLIALLAGPTRAADESTRAGADLREVIVEGANRGEAYRAQAKDRPLAQLLAATIERELRAGQPRQALSAAQLEALRRRVGVDVPADLARVLQTPGAWQALGWSDPAKIDRAETLGDQLADKLEAHGRDWRRQAIEVSDDDGAEFRIPAGDFGSYLVVSQRPEFGNLVLIDPSPRPKHPCCVVVETTMFAGSSHDAFPSLREYVESEWALGAAVEDLRR